MELLIGWKINGIHNQPFSEGKLTIKESFMITLVDVVVVIVYLAIMVVIGLIASKRIKHKDDYVLAGKRMGYSVTIGTLVATMIGTAATMGTAAMGYEYGMILVWQAIAIFVGYIIVGMLAKKIRKTGKWYIPDIMAERYGESAKVFTTIILAIAVTAIFGAQIIAMGLIFNLVGNSLGISYTTAIVIVGVILVLYTFIGGMIAVAYTDFIQLIIILVLFVLVLPIYVFTDGITFSDLRQTVDPEMWSVWSGLPFLFVVGIIATYLPGIIIDQTIWQRVMASKDEKVAKFSSFISGGIFLFYSIVILLLGITASVIIPQLTNKDEAIPQLIISYLPNGLIGLGLVAILAVAMSTASSTLLIAGVVITKDVIPAVMKKSLSYEQDLKASRIVTLILGAAGIVIALTFSGLFGLMMLAYAIFTATLFFPIIFALFWEKATKKGAFWSIIISSIILIVLYGLDKPLDVEPILPAIIINLGLMWIISLLTYQKDTATKPVFRDERKEKELERNIQAKMK